MSRFRRRSIVFVLLLIASAALMACADDGSETAAERRGPMIVAHRGGGADAPENTVLAIEKAVRVGVGGVWLTVQASSDGVPVLYRPRDLSANTNGSGPVIAKAASELAELNAGWNFQSEGNHHPYRGVAAVSIPTLAQALSVIPRRVALFIDIKQSPPQPVVAATAAVLRQSRDLERAVVYSTDTAVTDAARAVGGWHVFESRDHTRRRLLDVSLGHKCDMPAVAEGGWVAFEFRRKLTVTEDFTLGTASTVVDADLWTSESVRCLAAGGRTRTLAIGVDAEGDYSAARRLGINAVLVNSPLAAERWK